MQLILMMLVGSLLAGVWFEKLDRKTLAILAGMVIIAIIGFLYFRRFL